MLSSWRLGAPLGVLLLAIGVLAACDTTEPVLGDQTCPWLSRTLPEDTVGSETAILVDRSDSFRAASGSERGKKVMEAVVEQAVQGFGSVRGTQVVSVGTFDFSSASVGWLVKRLVLPPATGTVTGNQAADARVIRDCLARQLGGLLDVAPTGSGTDVVGALAEGARTFRSAPAGQRRLVVLTDGLSNTGCADLTRSQEAKILAKDCAGQVPSLAGVSVSLIGVGRPAEGTDPPDTGQDNRLRGLWSSLCSTFGVPSDCVMSSDLPPNERAPRSGSADPKVRLVGVTVTDEKVVITLPDDAYFETDSAQLTTAQRERVVRQVQEFLPAAYRSVQVAGYTDSRGTAEHNLELSRRRAGAVGAVLHGMGLHGVTAQGYGEGRPRCPHEFSGSVPDEDCLAENRRVEITILKGTT